MSEMPFGQERARNVALQMRMFVRDVLPWECDEHVPIEVEGLGRTWAACERCGFLTEPDQRDLLLRLLGSSD